MRGWSQANTNTQRARPGEDLHGLVLLPPFQMQTLVLLPSPHLYSPLRLPPPPHTHPSVTLSQFPLLLSTPASVNSWAYHSPRPPANDMSIITDPCLSCLFIYLFPAVHWMQLNTITCSPVLTKPSRMLSSLEPPPGRCRRPLNVFFFFFWKLNTVGWPDGEPGVFDGASIQKALRWQTVV